MLVGSRFRTVRPCTWVPTVGKSVPLPRRSLLVFGGNSGNIAKHCISSCKNKRISITLRKQPDPNWRPDESELAGKKSRNKPVKSVNASKDDAEKPKRKSLSGSAKRRKKMLKQRGHNAELNYTMTGSQIHAEKTGSESNNKSSEQAGKRCKEAYT